MQCQCAEDQIRQRQQLAELERENDLNICRQLVGIVERMFQLQMILQEEVEGTQWGKAGPGGAYWRSSALTGQGFFDKMVFIGIIWIYY